MREVVFGSINQYKVREDGKVFSNRSSNGHCNIEAWKEIKPSFGKCDYTGNGYLYISATLAKGVYVKIRIHRLVAKHFVKGYKKGLSVNHIDGNRLNNHWTNLEWVSHKKNMLNMKERGTRKGKGLMCGKLNQEQVLTVITLLNMGMKNSRISEHYKINQSAISDIKTKKSHKQFSYLLIGEGLTCPRV